MKKVAAIALAAVVLVAVILGVVALTSNTGHRGHSRHISGHSATHHKIATVTLPPATTTTVAPPETTTPSTAQPVAKVAQATPAATTTTTAPKVVTVVAPTTTTLPEGQNTLTVQTSTDGQSLTDGTHGMGCSSSSSTECVLLITDHNPAYPPRIAFIVSDGVGDDIGIFIPPDGGTQCLILWNDTGHSTVATSANCTGGPITSLQTTFNFTYSMAS